MSTCYYDTEEKRAAFVTEARSWIGTPFAENCAVKGRQGGVSCSHYGVAVHVRRGAWPAIALPVLPVEVVRAWHEHHSVSKILDFVGRPEIRARLRRVDEADKPAIGDIAVIRVENTEHHIGLFCGYQILHVTIAAGVIATSVHDSKFMARVRAYYRILA